MLEERDPYPGGTDGKVEANALGQRDRPRPGGENDGLRLQRVLGGPDALDPTPA